MGRIYEHQCKNEDCEVDRFTNGLMRDAVCPSCGLPATRKFDSITTDFHPSKSPPVLRLNSKKGRRGWY